MARFAYLAVLLALATSCLASPSSSQEVLRSPALVEKWSWVNCGLPSDAVEITSVEVSPDPPLPGNDVTVTVAGKVVDEVKEGAYADVTVKLGLIKILQKTFDLCEEARNANTSVQCPVKTGDYAVTHTITLPREIPPAKFGVNVRGYTADDDDLLCIDLVIDFVRRSLY